MSQQTIQCPCCGYMMTGITEDTAYTRCLMCGEGYRLKPAPATKPERQQSRRW